MGCCNSQVEEPVDRYPHIVRFHVPVARRVDFKAAAIPIPSDEAPSCCLCLDDAVKASGGKLFTIFGCCGNPEKGIFNGAHHSCLASMMEKGEMRCPLCRDRDKFTRWYGWAIAQKW